MWMRRATGWNGLAAGVAAGVLALVIAPPSGANERRIPTDVDRVVAAAIDGAVAGSPGPLVDSVVYDESGDAAGDEDMLTPDGSPVGQGGSEQGAGTEYATGEYTWDRTDLTYGFVNYTPDLPSSQVRDAVAGALDTWASVTPLTFTLVNDCGLFHNDPDCKTPDIRILFGHGDHGAGGSDPDFDGPGGVVAHAYGPVPDWWSSSAGGDIHLDEAETWKTNGGHLDLETVILHESGHALGLLHTSQGCGNPPGPNRPIMCTVLTGTQRVLAEDDIDGIQSLYGPYVPPLPPGQHVTIVEGGTTESSGSNDHVVQVINGDDTDLTDASLDVTGIDGCDQPDLTVPAVAVVEVDCPVDASDHLFDYDTSETLTVTATLTAPGMSPKTDGPRDIAVVADDHWFSDVPLWVDPAVDWISYWGLADGYPDNTYRPNNNITRAQVTRMLWRHAGSPTGAPEHAFSDVPPWVEEAVRWASFDPPGPEESLMSGYPNGTFGPNKPISRAEMARVLYRYAGSPDVASLPDHGFSDVPAWVEDAVRWGAHDPDGSGPLEVIIGGYPDGTFRPDLDITRAQETRMLFRLTDQLVD